MKCVHTNFFLYLSHDVKVFLYTLLVRFDLYSLSKELVFFIIICKHKNDIQISLRKTFIANIEYLW